MLTLPVRGGVSVSMNPISVLRSRDTAGVNRRRWSAVPNVGLN